MYTLHVYSFLKIKQITKKTQCHLNRHNRKWHIHDFVPIQNTVTISPMTNVFNGKYCYTKQRITISQL